MVIDTSALLAVLLDEPERAEFIELLGLSATRLVSAGTLLETSIVLEARRGEIAGRELDLFLYRGGIDVVPVDAEQTELARSGWRRFGKGRHAAALNFGDLFAYALAAQRRDEILFKGGDFSRTDALLATGQR